MHAPNFQNSCSLTLLKLPGDHRGGVVTRIYYEADSMTAVGKPLVDIQLDSAHSAGAAAKPPETTTKTTTTTVKASPQPASPSKVSDRPGPVAEGAQQVATLPSVRRLAKENEVDLSPVRATDKHGHTLKENLLAYLDSRAAALSSSAIGATQSPATTVTGESTERARLESIQRAMFKTMTRSLEIHHFNYSDEADLTELTRLLARERHTSCTAMAKQLTDEARYTQPRLPTGIKPLHYKLCLKPDFKQFTYSGQVEIEIENSSKTPTKSLVLNSVDLLISDGLIQEANNQLLSVIYSKESEAATLEFQDDILPKCKILLNFTGTLNDKLKGFYRTTFKVDGETAYAGATQFEPNDARRCFPCLDEPSMKATFTVSITIDKHMTIGGKQYERTALSNMPETSRSGPDSELTIEFQKTPIMSTYLLAFVVGPFECIETSNKGRPVRVYTTPGKKELGRFSLDVATKSLTFYEDYFKIDYPLPKMDLVAVPDFAFGAMENWGLITYREVRLLADPNNTATRVRQYTALVIAHEIAHQWFGNLVTMEWWTHLWLNEGFATFMEYLCINSVFPDWDISWFVADGWLRASRLDALDNSHPIEVPVQQPSDIDAIFDEISYEKGASVIRMMYEYIGDEAFRVGMHAYLKKFAYRNAVTEDLWESLAEASGKPVRDIMCDWTSKRGYPWVNIQRLTTAHDESAQNGDIKFKEVTLSQCQFSANGSRAGQNNEVWMIPINAISSENVSKVHELRLMGASQAEVKLPSDLFGSSWIKFNPDMMGLYRVAYPRDHLELLSRAVANKELPPMDRLNIQDDLFAFCASGTLEEGARTVDFLKLLETSYQDEDNYTVWLSIDANLDQIETVLSEQSAELKDKFSSYCRALYEKIYAKLGWDAQPGELNESMTRALVLNRMISAGEPSVIEEAKKRFKEHTDGTRMLAADLRTAVYKAVASYGDDDAFERLFKLHREAELAEEKNRAASALASTKDATRLKRVVEFAMSDEVKIQDKPVVLIPVGSNNPSVAFKLLQDRRMWFLENYESSFLLVRFIKTCLENFTSHEQATAVSKYFEANTFPGAERAVQQAVEMINLNAQWLERDKQALERYLLSR